MDLNTKTAALVIGIIFIVVGLLGFVPNPLVSPTGIFAVNTAHNLIHLATGIVIIAGAYSAFGARNTLLIFGAVYAVVAIAGFIPGLVDGRQHVARVHPREHGGQVAACPAGRRHPRGGLLPAGGTHGNGLG